MKRVISFFKLPELYCVILLAACIVAGIAMRVTFDDVKLIRNGATEDVAFPIAKKMNNGEFFQEEMDVRNTFGIEYDLRVVHDDCAESYVMNG